MNPDLEAIIAADEEARASVEAVRSASQEQIVTADRERERRRSQRYQELVQEAEDEERRLREETDRTVADRQSARARFRESRQRAAERALVQAADLYARIIDGGIAELQK